MDEKNQELIRYLGSDLNTRLLTQHGRQAAAELEEFYCHTPKLQPPSTRLRPKLDMALPMLTEQDGGIAYLSLGKVNRAFRILRDGLPEAILPECEANFNASLEHQLAPISWKASSVVRLFGPIPSERTLERWEHIRADVFRMQAGMFSHLFPEPSAYNRIIQERVERSVAGILGHYLLTIASQGDPEMGERELPYKIATLGELVEGIRAGNIPIGATYNPEECRRTYIILVA